MPELCRLARILCVTLIVLAGGVGTAFSQPAARPAGKPNQAGVGASDIFAALTQPDRPARLAALKALRETLAHHPDAAALQGPLSQVDALLQAETQREAMLPPDLVMSGIASRIEAAMSALEAARRDSASPRPPSWLIPGAIGIAAALAIALAACLVALATQGGRPDESSDEIREMLARIRRRLDEPAASTVPPAGLQEASAAVETASLAVSRFGNAAKEAEHQLRGSVDAAEVRLHAAASVAGEFEQWLEALPGRLAEAVTQMETKLAALADHAAKAGEKLPDLVAGIDRMGAAQEQAMRGAEAFALGQAALDSAVAASALTMQSLHDTRDEFTSSAELLTEMTNLAFGHALRLEDVIARAVNATHDLPSVGQVLEAAAVHLLRQIEQNDKLSEALSEARLADAFEAAQAHGISAMAKAIAQATDKLGAMSDGLDAQMAQSAQILISGRSALSQAAEAARAAQAPLGGCVTLMEEAARGLEAATGRVSQAASLVADLVSRDNAGEDAQTRTRQAETGPPQEGVPPELVSHTLILLAAIEASTQRLRRVATTLAVADEVRRKAA